MHVPEIADDPLDPTNDAWKSVPTETVRLVPVPLEEQPNEYIRTAWRTRPYGRVAEVDVAAARRGERLFVRLEWNDSEEPNTEFLDGAGVFFPDSADGAPPLTIGSHGAPVQLWAWRDRLPVQEALPPARELVASGPGAFRTSDSDPSVSAASALSGGRWSVVIAGDLAPASMAQRMGVVVWDGSNDERAGIGAVTPGWVPLAVN